MFELSSYIFELSSGVAKLSSCFELSDLSSYLAA